MTYCKVLNGVLPMRGDEDPLLPPKHMYMYLQYVRYNKGIREQKEGGAREGVRRD